MTLAAHGQNFSQVRPFSQVRWRSRTNSLTIVQLFAYIQYFINALDICLNANQLFSTKLITSIMEQLSMDVWLVVFRKTEIQYWQPVQLRTYNPNINVTSCIFRMNWSLAYNFSRNIEVQMKCMINTHKDYPERHKYVLHKLSPGLPTALDYWHNWLEELRKTMSYTA